MAPAQQGIITYCSHESPHAPSAVRVCAGVLAAASRVSLSFPLPAAGQRHVLWHNMREEPVLYINGKPYVVREADQPFCNVEYTGMLLF